MLLRGIMLVIFNIILFKMQFDLFCFTFWLCNLHTKFESLGLGHKGLKLLGLGLGPPGLGLGLHYKTR